MRFGAGTHLWLVMVAFGLIGICTCMMWPGILLVTSNKLPFAGVLVFGVLCGVGDLGAAIAGQAIGVLSDFFSARAPQGISLTPEQYVLRIAIAVPCSSRPDDVVPTSA
jgi:fucose permease